MSKNRNNKTRRTSGMLAALLLLTLAGEASAYAQPSEPSDHLASVQQVAALSSAAPGDLKNGPRDAKEVEAFLDAFFARDAIKQKPDRLRSLSFKTGRCLSPKGMA